MSEVVAVSISTPKRVTIGGLDLETSIVRDPSPGPIYIDSDGPVGNRTAVHPEAVFVFIAEHYDYWAARLGVDRGRWRFGHWGENLTISGLSEFELRIGDIVRIGGTFVGQISSPRNPCLKLAWRLEQPMSVLKTLVEDGRMGFYLRVLRPGLVKAGDAVSIESPHPGNLTIAEIPRLIHDPNAAEGRLRFALQMPALSDYPAGFLRSRLNQVTDEAWAKLGRWSGWRTFEIERIEDEAAEIRSFYLRPADGEPVAAHRPGQFLTVRLDEMDDLPAIRSWSISDYDTKRVGYRLSIKREPRGVASHWMHDNARIGTRLSARAPAGRFVLDRSSVAPVILISAGIGVTPLLAMLKAHLERPEGKAPPLFWIHCTRDGAVHPFKKEVEALVGARTDVVRLIHYSQPKAKDRPGDDFDREGRLDIASLAEVLGTISMLIGGRRSEVPGQICSYYLCGPEGFQTSIQAALIDWGVPAHGIRTESFSAHEVEGAADEGFDGAKIVFARSGVEARWSLESGLSLLELAEANGITAESSCRMGNCHSCMCRLRCGEVSYRFEVDQLGEGQILPCCAVPASQKLVLDL